MIVEVVDFRPHTRSTLRGFLTIRLTTVGLEVRDLALHEKDGNRWLQLPAKPFNKPSGGKGWNYILHFYEKDQYQQFQEMTLKALDAFQREAGRNSEYGSQ